MRFVIASVISLALSTGAIAASVMERYPVLAIPRAADSEVLLNYELTADERKLFGEIDRATAKLPRNAEAVRYRAIAVEIGKKYGLSAEQSIAFFVRTTFSEFEPQ